jgi:hypothetical protein
MAGLVLLALCCLPGARAEDLEFGPSFGAAADAARRVGASGTAASDSSGPGETADARQSSDSEADSESEEAADDPEARKDARECREALEVLKEDRLSCIDLDIRVGGRAGNDYPRECRLEGDVYQSREFATTTFTWKAAGYCHKPLYFEQWNLERYGHSRGLVADMFLSGAHFFATVPVLPYKMGVELPWECIYPLGYYRPGSCAPWTVPAIPVSPRGLAVEAATATGAVFLLP